MGDRTIGPKGGNAVGVKAVQIAQEVRRSVEITT
jgi:hypothetical protein